MAGSELKPDADPRVLLAAERTLLAWIRTGLALMGFGFVVARFGLFLREMAGLAGRAEPESVLGGGAIGAGIVGGGVLVTLWASLRHRRMFRRLEQGLTDIGVRGPVAIGLTTGAGGVLLLSVLLAALLRG